MKISNKQKLTTSMSILFAGLMTLSAGTAMAQPGYGTNDPGSQATASTASKSYDEQTLQNVAAASVELNKIQQDYAAKLENIQTREEAMELQRQTNKRMVQAVEENDIDVSTYNSVTTKMSEDKALRKKVKSFAEQQQ